MIKNGIAGIFFCFFLMNSYAQNFRWETKIEKITKKGFYTVLLTPSITAHMKDDFSDIRIYDQQHVEIPFLLKIEELDDEATRLNKTQLFEMKDFKISQRDSSEVKRSYIKISFPEQQYIDRLELEMEGPSFFLRKASIAESIPQEEIVEKNQDSFESIQYFEVSSTDSTKKIITNFRAKEFYILIENEDNQPLKVSSLKIYQAKKYLTTLLEKEGDYLLQFGDENAVEPRYDLKYFETSIPLIIPELSTGALIELFPGKEKEMNPETSNNKTVLWVVISIVVIVLGILSIKMVKDLKRNVE